MTELFQHTTPPKAFFPWKTIAIAVTALALAGFVLVHLTWHRTNADVTITQVKLYPSHIVFKHTFGIVGRDQTEDDMYVIATIAVKSNVPAPLSIDGITGVLTLADGSTLNATAVEKSELPNLFTSFPAVKTLAGPPLYRETIIAPGATVDGTIILHYPVDQKTWDARKSSTISVTPYHQPALTVELPK